jgi:hypothetical protein
MQMTLPSTATLAGYDAAECARLNDLCRLGRLASARIVITRNCLEALSDPDKDISGFLAQMHISAKLRNYSFEGDDDPHGERDFGCFEVAGHKLFWKIDYYDPSLEFGSKDPTDTAQTTRILTVMLASDY